MPQRIPDNFEVRKPRLLDNKEGPWSSVEEATLYITKDIRAQGQVVKILNAGSIEEWWWKDGIEDADLIAKSSGGGSLPAGGDAGQLLAKNSATDYDFTWIDNYADWTSQLKHEVKLGEAISKGQAVYVSSADGTNMIVTKASNASEATSSKTMGLLETGGSTNAKVKVITEGLLAGLDTSSANSAGDPVWLGTSGNLIYGLANKPIAPNHLVFIGIVTRKQSNNGEIFIKVQNGFELKEIHDVQAQSPSNKNSIFFDSSDSQWKARAVSATDIDANVSNAEFGYLDGVTSSIQTQLNDKEPTISAGTTSQYWRGDKSWQTLNSTAVGLGNVDNTSDANKPVSTATQTALNLKANTSDTPKVLYRLSTAVTIPANTVTTGSIINIPRSSVSVGQMIEVRMIASTPSTAPSANRTLQARWNQGANAQSLTVPINSSGVQNAAFISFARVSSTGVTYARTTTGSSNQGTQNYADVGSNIVLEYIVDPSNQTFTIEHITVTIF